MTRRESLILLAVFGAGAFLAGLELMVTAVALPSIVADLATWTELRRASWIINAYLLVYVVTMPLAGRLADLWGARRLLLGALVAFTVGSTIAGAAQTLDQLIAGRLIQGIGGGALVPVATAAASHLFERDARPRALGVVGALTFLGMAAGPFAGAAILDSFHVGSAIERYGLAGTTLGGALSPAWRYVFYLNVPIGIIALALAWAASTGWDTPRREGRVDVAGAVFFSAALAAGLVGLTLVDDQLPRRLTDATYPPIWLLAAALVAIAAIVASGLRRRDPFLDPHLFGDRVFSAATLVSLLTGYALATAIIGGAVFVDRVLYGHADDQRIALGALAGATAFGALASGFLVRHLTLRLVTLAGLVASALGLAWMATWSPSTTIAAVAGGLALYGVGFGLTVTPRSTAAVEAVGSQLFGVAAAAVTVARMIGMAIGLAVLTAYGSTTIERLSADVYSTPDAYKAYIPADLRDRPLRDGLVVEALEGWAAGEAARIMVGLFLVAGAVTLVAIPPGLVLRGGSGAGRALAGTFEPVGTGDAGAGDDRPSDGHGDDLEDAETRLAL
ncbi:MAG TPA: MFS transporter [Candidatus Limnocylindrales bacterium]